MKNKLLSILIPTKNRYPYLLSCLSSLRVNYNVDEIEIIITDNSTHQEDLSHCLSGFNNVKYSYISNPISQVENFELALSLVSGKYVTMIGDDDGLCGTLLEVVRFMERKNIDALNSPFVTYYWPDVITKNKSNNFSGKMVVGKYCYELTEIDPFREIMECLNLGATSLCNMPRMYYGIIRKDILNQVKNVTGYYFPGPSPDMANAFSASLFVKKFVYFDAPLFIAGNSANSAAGLGLAGKHVSEIEGNPQLPKDCHLNWSPFVPKYWSGPTIWAESVSQVIIKSNRKDLLEKFNFSRLYAACLTFNPEYKSKILIAIESYSIWKRYSVILKIKYSTIIIWLLRVKFYYKNMIVNKFSSNKHVFTDIINIEEAADILFNYDHNVLKKVINDN